MAKSLIRAAGAEMRPGDDAYTTAQNIIDAASIGEEAGLTDQEILDAYTSGLRSGAPTEKSQ